MSICLPHLCCVFSQNSGQTVTGQLRVLCVNMLMSPQQWEQSVHWTRETPECTIWFQIRSLQQVYKYFLESDSVSVTVENILLGRCEDLRTVHYFLQVLSCEKSLRMWPVLPLPEDPGQDADRCVAPGLHCMCVTWVMCAVTGSCSHLPSCTRVLETSGTGTAGPVCWQLNSL